MVHGTFGSRLAWLRESAGISGRALARLVPSLSKNYASETEKKHGDVSPTRDKALAICEVFGVKYDWLVLGKGKSPTKKAIRFRIQTALDRLKREEAA